MWSCEEQQRTVDWLFGSIELDGHIRSIRPLIAQHRK